MVPRKTAAVTNSQPSRPAGPPQGAATTTPAVSQLVASTTVAEALRPPVALYMKITCPATEGDVWSAWVAEPGTDAILMVAYNPDAMPRSVVDYMIARRHGVPAEIVEVDFDAMRSEREAAAAAEAIKSAVGGQ